MNQNRVIVCCDKHTSLNTREEDMKICPPKKDGCAQEIVDPCKRVECNPCKQANSDPCKKSECESKKVERSPCQKLESEPKKVECGQRTAKLSRCCASSSGCEKPMKQCSERVLCPVTATVKIRGCDDEPAPEKSFVPEKMVRSLVLQSVLQQQG
jgi:hypothetical protein